MNSERYNDLSDGEERVIIHKGTDPPFTGKYDDHWEKGIYLCKRCDAPLYYSNDKFDASCGWPSFDEEIPGMVERHPDADGSRTEIVCANCSGHLGHVFLGEGLTKKSVRHCVNSTSLNFTIVKTSKQELRAIFAGGCFWGTEYFFQRFKGVTSTRVGYVGGHKETPTYEEVCYKDTGHAEAVEVLYDPEITSYEELVKLFFEIHDPTQVNQQGPDIGEQYRSEIFYLDDEQKDVVERLINILKDRGYKVATKVSEAKKFWKAEDYHQDYYNKTGNTPYCHRHTKRF
jgi:peptide methionine sulfoxide reductase msrA/msrB